MLNKDTLKNELSIEQVFEFVEYLGGEPRYDKGDSFVSRTICHNDMIHYDEASYKLYYYDNTHLFHCYTGCEEPSFDIYQLTMKVKKIPLNKAIAFTADYFGLAIEEEHLDFDELPSSLPDWDILKQYNDRADLPQEQRISLKIYDTSILDFLPRPRIIPWEREGISSTAIKEANICYDPINQGIVIPHYDIDNHLIGIRERTLIKEEESNGKYRPAYLNGVLYSHPLGFNLYNLNNSKQNIQIIKKAIIFESEKATLSYRTFFGRESDISVACCGSNLLNYQANLLSALGVNEILVAFDRQFKKVGDEEYKIWTNKLKKINDKYKSFFQISFIFDRRGLLGYKDSPIDKGKDIFMKLLKERIML